MYFASRTFVSQHAKCCKVQPQNMADIYEQNTTNCSISQVFCPKTGTVAVEIFALVFIFILSSLGNILILVVIKRSRRSEWTTNFFVTGLAISNLLTPFLCVLWTIVWILKGAWILGNVSCKVTFFFHFLNAGVSVGFLACISLDRFYVIVHPLKLKMTRVQTRELIAFVWIFMLCASAPTLIFFKTKTTGENMNFCLNEFGTAERVFILIFFAVALCFPSIFTFTVYIRVSVAVIRRNRQASGYSNDYRRMAFKVPRSKVKVLQMLLIQWFVFFACCFPYFVTLVARALSAVEVSRSLYMNLLIWSYSNAGLNVVIYAFFNEDFRRGCKRVFCKPDASQAYRLTTLGRKNRIAPFEFSSGDHGEGFDFGLTEHKKETHTNGSLAVSTHGQTHAWPSPEPSPSTTTRRAVLEIHHNSSSL